MVDEAVPQPVLSIAGELLAINGQIIAAVELRVDPQLRQGADDWGNVLLELAPARSFLNRFAYGI